MQRGDETANTAKHAFDLVMATFVKCHLSTTLAEQHEFRRQCGDVFGSEVKATLEGGDGIAGDGRISFNDIGLWHLGLSVHELLGPAAIIREQKQTRGPAVEPTGDVQRELVGIVDQIDHRLMLGIHGGAHDSAWLVQHQVERSLSLLHEFSIQLHARETIHFMLICRADQAIHMHPPGGDEPMRLAPPERAVFGDEAIQFHPATLHRVRRWVKLFCHFFRLLPTTMKLLPFAALLVLSSLQAAEPPAGFKAIFNGKDLTGWYGLNPHSVQKLTGEKKDAALKKMREEFPTNWKAENGELVNDGHGPYATTEQEFGDMEFLIEYKTVPKADSGIYLRGVPQVQIWDKSQVFDPAKPTRRPHLGSGGLFNNTPDTPGRDPLVIADKDLGEWNSFRIRQIGARTWVWLNDKLVVDGAPMENYPDKAVPYPAKGPIMLQTHGGEIRWRNLFVREIGADEAKKILAEADAKK
jgi:hypothetical protein